MGRVPTVRRRHRPGTRDGGVAGAASKTGNCQRFRNRPVEVTAVSVNIKPLEDKIVVQASEAEATTASGLVIPDTAKQKPQEGKVIAVGPGRIDDNGNRVPLDVAVGDVVIYSKYGGTEVKYGGAEELGAPARRLLRGRER